MANLYYVNMFKKLFSFLFCLIVSISGCNSFDNYNQTSRIVSKIACSINPIADIAKNIVQEKMEIITILPPGASPHTFEPNPSQIKALNGSKIVFAIGHGLDNWIDPLISSINAKKIIVDKNIKLKKNTDEDSESDYDPHYWLTAENAKIIAENIYNEIIIIDPANKAYYSENLKKYQKQLDELNKTILDELSTISNKKIITFHNGWNYFADAYEFEVIAAFEPFPGKEPTPQFIKELMDTVKSNNIKVIFSEPQFSDESIKSFVNDQGLKLYILDYIGTEDNRKSYIDLLKYNTDTLKKALNNE
jgi:zinc transport system substrate-binding protein